MRDHLIKKIIKRETLICVLSISLFFFSTLSKAQGWSFSFQLAYSGDCGGANITLPTFPNITFPTKSECESFRQYVLSVKFTGTCTVYYTCTPCTGSDMVIPGQTTPGDVNFEGQNTGNPYFSTHNSKAYEDWARDYIQQLQSYGINSILNTNLNNSNVPLTGNSDFDNFYSSGSQEFNPTAQSQQKDVSEDQTIIYGTVQLLTTREEQAKRDQWYDNQIAQQGFTNLTQMDENNTIKPDYNVEKITEAIGTTLLNEHPVGSIGVNVCDNVMDGLNKITPLVQNLDFEGAVAIADPLPGNTVSNILLDKSIGAITDQVGTPLLKAVPGASTVYTVINVSSEFWKNLNK